MKAALVIVIVQTLGGVTSEKVSDPLLYDSIELCEADKPHVISAVERSIAELPERISAKVTGTCELSN